MGTSWDWVVGFPVVVGLVALARAAHLKGWKDLMKADFRPRIPKGAVFGLLILLIVQTLFGLLRHTRLIDRHVARIALAPCLTSLAITLCSTWVLVANWRQAEESPG